MKLAFRTFIALAVALFFSAVLSADTFDWNYANGPVSASGTLTGNLILAGQYNITDGTINLVDTANSAMDGSGIMEAIQSNGNFYTGGGTILTFSPGWNTFLFPDQNPEIDQINGAFTFRLDSGPGAGNGVFIGAAGPDSYQMFAGNWGVVQWGGGDFTTSSVPEPASIWMLCPAIVGVGIFYRRRARQRRC